MARYIELIERNLNLWKVATSSPAQRCQTEEMRKRVRGWRVRDWRCSSMRPVWSQSKLGKAVGARPLAKGAVKITNQESHLVVKVKARISESFGTFNWHVLLCLIFSFPIFWNFGGLQILFVFFCAPVPKPSGYKNSLFSPNFIPVSFLFPFTFMSFRFCFLAFLFAFSFAFMFSLDLFFAVPQNPQTAKNARPKLNEQMWGYYIAPSDVWTCFEHYQMALLVRRMRFQKIFVL